MLNSPYKLALAIIAMALAASSAWAGSASIEGGVLDQKGQPMKGGSIRVEHSGGSTWNVTAKTDGKGFYAIGNLEPEQNYRVTLLVNNQVKASINNVKTHKYPAAMMNFDLSKNSKLADQEANVPITKKKTHTVWMPGETGSNLGGRWVEVQEGGNEAGVNNVKKASGDAIRSLNMGGR
jgi:hypothetical protein